MISNIRVGIPIIGSSGWQGGASYMGLHVKAVASLPRNERPRLFLVVSEHNLESFEIYRSFIHLFDGIIFNGQNIFEAKEKIGQDIIHCLSLDELFEKIDFYFPVNYNVLPGRCAASWIHDFQHKYLPELFPTEDRLLREELCQKIADESRLVFCFSRAVKEDFVRFYPESKAVIRALPLRISPEESWYQGNPQETQCKYGLPDHFILCSNQFWAHKNHRILLQALAHLKQEGIQIDLVCTGSTGDFRCPGYFGEVQQYIATLGLYDRVHILGLIPRQDQIQLIRRSLFVVQPSLFEGLSLIVQECKALGKQIILSDLEAHFEQEYGSYFRRTDPKDLAAKISELLPISAPGPNLKREAEARMHTAGLVTRYAKEFCSLVEESLVIFNRKDRLLVTSTTKCNVITIATSIQLSGSVSVQQKAINSWLNLGFRVVAVNSGTDIPTLLPLFPKVEFYAPENSRESMPVSFNDILNGLKQYGTEICGISEPEIYLSGDKFYQMILKEASSAAVFGPRIELNSLEMDKKNEFSYLGYIFFPKGFLTHYPEEAFGLETPGWDIWFMLILLKQGIALRRLSTPAAYHIVKLADYRLQDWLRWGERIIKYAPPTFSLTLDTISRYHAILFHIINKHAVEVKIPNE